MSATQLDRSSSIILHDPPDPGAQAWIDQHSLQPWIDEVCHLITSRFDADRPLAIEKHSDAEFTDEWITVRIIVKGDMEQVLDGYDDVTRRLVEILPNDVARKLRLSVGIA